MTAVCARPVVDVWGELRELGEAMRHCQASYAHTFTSSAHRSVIARYCRHSWSPMTDPTACALCGTPRKD